MTRVLRNPCRRDPVESGDVAADPAVWAFHARMPAYAPTLLLDCPTIASALGVGRVLVKAETQRMGLPSFKILGASWATYRALCDHVGSDLEPWANTTQLAERLASLKPFALAAATDGNHGRAVAFMARTLGFEARIFVPSGTVRARIEAIENEGASVRVVEGDYDAAVARSAEEAGERCLVISDTSWPGYEITPRRVIQGYTTIFCEIDSALAAAGIAAPDAVVVPVGVGALMAAAVVYLSKRGEDRPHIRALSAAAARRQPGTRSKRGNLPLIVGVEPAGAACVLASAEAGHLVTVPGPHRSIMAGLNCGTPSMLAWPLVSAGVDWFVAVEDDTARAAMRDLAASGVVAGETGAAALAGVAAALAGDHGPELRAGGLGPSSTVLLLATEGATDPAAYEQIVGRAPAEIGTVLTVAP